MIIDFHTHAFPDTLAPRAMSSLITNSNNFFPAHTDGTVKGLKENMQKAGIDISVLQPVITKPSQTRTLNEWAKSVQDDKIIAFGGVHPDTDDYKRDIDFICDLGLKGLKFHAEYQNFFVDEPRMLKIYDYAFSKGLIILHHAGYDPAFENPNRATPERFQKVARAMQGGTLVVAHLGGQSQWDDVEKYLVGENVYLDTSMGFWLYSKEQFLRIYQGHGAKKLLFGSDTPWSDSKLEVDLFNAIPIPKEDRELIFSGNAKRLLGLSTTETI
jgi:predicted TIM-barrel fold metal-dependent hydrolase